MKYEVNRFNNLFNSTKVEAESLLSIDSFNIEYYHLFKGNSLHIDSSNGNSEIQPVLYYIILKGSVEVYLPNKVIKLSQNEKLEIDFSDPTSFEIYALEEASILYIINSGNSIIDKKIDDLLELVADEEKREPYTRKHNDRVGKLALMMMQVIDPGYNKTDLTFAASYHDVGKLKVSSDVLNKPGKLTDEEFNEIKNHPAYSYDILTDFFDESVAKIARAHHEKLDGSGYPDGLKAEEIPFESKVIAIADIYDALTSKRCYRDKVFTQEEALAIINGDVKKGKLDKRCYDALKQIVDSYEFNKNED